MLAFTLEVTKILAFTYQHVGNPNAKFCIGGLKPTQGPNVSVLASQWI